MKVIAVHSSNGSKFSEPKLKSNFAFSNFERFIYDLNDFCSLLVDTHRTCGAHIHYLRIRPCKEPLIINFSEYGAVYQIFQSSEFGSLLRAGKNNNKFTIWLPSKACEIRLDDHQRMSSSQNTFFPYKWEFIPEFRLNVFDFHADGALLTIPYIVFEDASGDIFKEFNEINEIERLLFRKSDWFYASSFSDIWNYLINGSIYDPRTHKGIEKRFKCQQCAYSWWSYFGFLYNETGKQIYTILQDEVAYSVLLDMSAEGEWGHGYWSDNFETHSRFHLDGLHLLISQYVKTGQPIWLEAAERGFDFVVKHLMETLDDGSLWFLHDTIEHQRNHHFQSNLFGKSSDNSLCLNTHVQALTVLYRLRSAKPEKEIYSDIFDKGIAALQKVLDYQPGDFFYKPLLSWMVHLHTMGKPVSLLGRIKHRIEGRISSYIYWLIRPHYPRLTLPSGFTERDLTLSCFSARYHILNIKDLLSLYQQTPFPWLRPYIINGFKFIREFIVKLDLTKALASSPFYIEFIDILYLYNKLIENNVGDEEINRVKESIYQESGGYSLDYYASELVRGKLSD